MSILLADVGGTNARLALAGENGLDTDTIRRFRGDDHATFDEVVRLYLQQLNVASVQAVCVDVAGPVGNGEAKLTNRDWSFSEAGLRALTGASQARLINDMVALGYATPGLSGEALGQVRAAPMDRSRNGQRLVVNAGTGFNVCAVKVLPQGGIACLEAEEGHTRLPLTIAEALAAEVPPATLAGFDSVEELFAGRGLSRLHAARTGQPAVRAEQVTEAADTDAEARATCDLYARLFGLLCRELALRFMPMEGIYLAGSVARFAANRQQIFLDAFLSDPLMARIPQAVPIHVIRDDMAALHGCLAAVR